MALPASARQDKRALAASTFDLTEAEAKKLQLLYDACQRDVGVANRWRSRVVAQWITFDRPLSDEFARDLAGT